MGDLEKEIGAQKINPDVIDSFPQMKVEITYDSLKPSLGTVMTPTQVKNKPKLTWETTPDTFYTLLMTDPDAPSKAEPKFREWHHWLVMNIPGCNVSEGVEVMQYIGSGPPPKTGLHRYIFLVYKQPGKIEYTGALLTNRSADGRACNKARDMAQTHKLGEPVAINWFEAEYDDYVPTLYKQLQG